MNWKYYQCQIPIGSLPINLVLVGNTQEGKAVFVKVAPFACVFDADAEGNIQAAFYAEEFILFTNADSEEVFQYDTIYNYKELPAMLGWLQQQKLQQP